MVASTSSLASAGFCVGEMIFAQLIFIKKKTAQRMHARNFISNQVVRDDSNSTVMVASLCGENILSSSIA